MYEQNICTLNISQNSDSHYIEISQLFPIISIQIVLASLGPLSSSLQSNIKIHLY